MQANGPVDVEESSAGEPSPSNLKTFTFLSRTLNASARDVTLGRRAEVR